MDGHDGWTSSQHSVIVSQRAAFQLGGSSPSSAAAHSDSPHSDGCGQILMAQWWREVQWVASGGWSGRRSSLAIVRLMDGHRTIERRVK